MSKWKWARLSSVAALAFCTPSFAADLPASESGSRTIADFVAAYAGKSAAPSVKITTEGSSYLVSLDLAAASAVMKGAGVSYDPAIIKFRVFQQDDGQWRIELASFPPISAHGEVPGKPGQKIDINVTASHFEQTTWLDPKVNWIGAIKGSADKLSFTERLPGVEEFFEFGQLKFSSSTKSGASGLTFALDEPFSTINFVFDVDPKAVDPNAKATAKPVHVSAQGEGGKVSVSLEDFQPAPLLDAWKFAAAHPERADRVKDADMLQSAVTALFADHFKLIETVSLDKLSVTSEVGPVVLEGATIGVDLVNGGAGSGFAERFAARSIKLPDGLLPPMYAPLVPTSFEFGFKAIGFDAAAAAQEFLARAKTKGNGEPLSDAEQGEVAAKLLGSQPIVVDLLPGHLIGPSLDFAFQGKVTIANKVPTGAVTLTLRGVDKTIAALQGMGPDAQKQLVPVIAMVKGLGKPGPDGSLVWLCEVGADHVMKVNGLPLGKSPF